MNAVVAKTTLQLERVKRCIVDEYCRVTHNDSSYTSRRDLVKVSCGRNYLRYLLTQNSCAAVTHSFRNGLVEPAALDTSWYRTSVPLYQAFRMCKQYENRRFWYVSGNSWYRSLLSPQYVRLRFSAVHDPSISRCVGKIHCTASDL